MMDDAFAAGVDAPEDDPFAGAEDDFEQAASDPFDDPPQVDREGNPVQAEPDPTMGQASTSSSPPASDGGTSDQTESDGGPGESAPPTSPSTSADGGESGSGEPDPSTGEANAGEAGSSGGSEPDPTAESTSSTEPGAEAGGEPDPTSGGTVATEDLEGEQEIVGKDGKVTHRRYVVFQPIGQGRFEQIVWHEDDDGRMVSKGTEGAKRRTTCLVRSREDALAVGFAAIGAPQGGADLRATTVKNWASTKVRPKPITQPIRSRLTFE